MQYDLASQKGIPSITVYLNPDNIPLKNFALGDLQAKTCKTSILDH